MIPSVNYHLWEACNMRCKFCFATFQDVKNTILPKGHLPKEESLAVVKKLAEAGFEKITFVGGEPTLCPWLGELILTAKSYGLTTMIVTNGTNLSDHFLSSNRSILDWISLSIDSINNETNLKSGRAIAGKKVISRNEYEKLVDRIKQFGYGLKINTVVNALNVDENMIDFIDYAKPNRWKIFQALPIDGQNDGHIDSILVTKENFEKYVERHKNGLSHIKIVAEDNAAMKGTYAMVDPAGRFFDNVGRSYKYSHGILEIGVSKAIQQVEYNLTDFLKREGKYDWVLLQNKTATVNRKQI